MSQVTSARAGPAPFRAKSVFSFIPPFTRTARIAIRTFEQYHLDIDIPRGAGGMRRNVGATDVTAKRIAISRRRVASRRCRNVAATWPTNSCSTLRWHFGGTRGCYFHPVEPIPRQTFRQTDVDECRLIDVVSSQARVSRANLTASRACVARSGLGPWSFPPRGFQVESAITGLLFTDTNVNLVEEILGESRVRVSHLGNDIAISAILRDSSRKALRKAGSRMHLSREYICRLRSACAVRAQTCTSFNASDTYLLK